MHKLQSKVSNPGGSPKIEMRARFLRLCAEHCVPAPDIRHYGVRAPCVIPQLHAMLLARTSAILVTRAIREKAAENAVLRMENRQVLISDHLQVLRTRVAGEARHLRGIEIVGGSQSRHQLEIPGGRQRIGGIQTEI